MVAPGVHRPGPAPDTEPPPALLALADALHDPAVVSVGITTTHDGRWALYVTVPGSTEVPLAEVERARGGFPVVYAAAPDEPARAYEPSQPPHKARSSNTRAARAASKKG
mgnify:CR=1 FL=1